MNRFLTPFLRKVYFAFGFFLLSYTVALLFLHSEWHKETLYRRLIYGTQSQQVAAGYDLTFLQAEKQLLRALRTPSPEARAIATQSLWNIWFHAAGPEAYAWAQQALQATDRAAFPEALKILNRIVKKYPMFAEGWNRRATLYWKMGKYRESVDDCRKVLSLNPNHFGALEGMALCQLHLGQVQAAYLSLQSVLRITPFNESAQNLMGWVEQLQPRLKPPPPGVLI